MDYDGPARHRLSHHRRVVVLAALAGLPGVAASVFVLWHAGYSAKAQWTFGLLVVGGWLALLAAVRGAVVRSLQTLASLLGALREQDFSFRARPRPGDDPLGQVMNEVNELARALREDRLGALEAGALLRRVIEEIDVAVFTFDADEKLRLVNRAGERLLARPTERLLGASAAELGLAEALHARPRRVLELSLPGELGRFEARRGLFREAGRPHTLLVLANLSHALREEERLAWQRLIRVLGHELNNSLAPIRSIAGSLERLMEAPGRSPEWDADVRRGLSVISSRSESLSRFMEAYARLARLPPPQLGPVDVGSLLRRVSALDPRVPVEVVPGPPSVIRADADQLEQLLINLVRNAQDAAAEGGGSVRAGWAVAGGHLDLFVEDDGPGLPPAANLFVPFFTTKPRGTGIGLVLSRQIAEAHGGTLTLRNRATVRGCRAELRLPA
jgi:nitrogen fixation/metabolism regulation signal transduction histidine kinase